MRIRTTAMILGVFLLTVIGAQGAQPRRAPEVSAPKQANVPTTSFTEVERQRNYSVVSVTIAPGAGTPPSMFVVRNCYEMAKRRGAAYFVTLKEWQDANGNLGYVVGFAPDDKVDPATFFGVPVEQKTLTFRAVKDYDLLWGTGR